MFLASSVIFGFLAILAVLLVLLHLTRKRLASLYLDNQNLRFSKQSLSTKYGKLSEQFMPFLASYPYNAQAFRFLGTPIDGIQFEEEKIIFMEFKTAGSQLSPLQKHIRQLVIAKKIEWHEFALREPNDG